MFVVCIGNRVSERERKKRVKISYGDKGGRRFSDCSWAMVAVNGLAHDS